MQQVIFLSDPKVFKLTNGNGHLGLRIPGSSVKRTVGVRWNLLKNKHEPDTNSVISARYTIKRLKKDTYDVECLDEFMPGLMLFLLERCGIIDVKLPSKKKRGGHRRNVKVHKDSYFKYGLR